LIYIQITKNIIKCLDYQDDIDWQLSAKSGRSAHSWKTNFIQHLLPAGNMINGENRIKRNDFRYGRQLHKNFFSH